MLRPSVWMWSLAVLLLVAGLICGCKKEEEGEDEIPTAQLEGQLEAGIQISVHMWGEAWKHVYEGEAGQVIDLSVISNTLGLDPKVQLLDPSGREEAFDDDSGGKGNALIREHLLQSSGTYTVRVETDEDQTGDVSVVLSVARSAEGAPAAPPSTERIPVR
jgi:hypothetical protein